MRHMHAWWANGVAGTETLRKCVIGSGGGGGGCREKARMWHIKRQFYFSIIYQFFDIFSCSNRFEAQLRSRILDVAFYTLVFCSHPASPGSFYIFYMLPFRFCFFQPPKPKGWPPRRIQYGISNNSYYISISWPIIYDNAGSCKFFYARSSVTEVDQTFRDRYSWPVPVPVPDNIADDTGVL